MSLQSTMTYATAGHANDESATAPARATVSLATATTPGVAALAVSPLRRLIDNLIKRREDIVCKLYLRHRFETLRGSPDTEAHDTLLGQWGVEHSVAAELGGQVHAASEDAAEGYIFAEEDDGLVGAEGMGQCSVDGLVEV